MSFHSVLLCFFIPLAIAERAAQAPVQAAGRCKRPEGEPGPQGQSGLRHPCQIPDGAAAAGLQALCAGEDLLADRTEGPRRADQIFRGTVRKSREEHPPLIP